MSEEPQMKTVRQSDDKSSFGIEHKINALKNDLSRRIYGRLNTKPMLTIDVMNVDTDIQMGGLYRIERW